MQDADILHDRDIGEDGCERNTAFRTSIPATGDARPRHLNQVIDQVGLQRSMSRITIGIAIV